MSPEAARPGGEKEDFGFIKNKLRDHFSEDDLRNKSLRQLIDQKFYERYDEGQRLKKVSDYDIPELERKRSDKSRYYEDRSNSTWLERLTYMWTPDEYGYLSPELQFVQSGTMISFLSAAVYGSWHESAKIYRIFMEQNKYTMFQVGHHTLCSHVDIPRT